MSKVPIALQLYTVRQDIDTDLQRTLRNVAEIGYAGVEFAGYADWKATELKSLLADLNLRPAGGHVPIDQLEKDIHKVIHFNLELGNPYVVCPWIPEERRKDKADWLIIADLFNSVGQKCRQNGLTFCYHNHSFEFEKFGDTYALDLLFGATRPNLVNAELDTYWVKHGGEDPVDYLRRYAGRCALVHLKDMAGDEKRSFAEVGAGILDWDAIFEAAEAGGAEWYIVEQDTCPGPPIESARISFENLKKWGKV
ncbi:sugar phosphate isomerase/epimerase [bacterium]|nr:sugar phosphate isomerase/epimerase [bacterium]